MNNQNQNIQEQQNSQTISEYISLAEGAEYSGYSQDYLRFRIRQEKLKAKKIARNWVTTKEWLDEYLRRVADYKNGVRFNQSKENIVKEQAVSVGVKEAEPAQGLEETPTGEEKSEQFIEAAAPVSEKASEEEIEVEVIPSKFILKPIPSVDFYSFSEPFLAKKMKFAGLVLAMAASVGALGFLLGFYSPAVRAGFVGLKKTIEVSLQELSEGISSAADKLAIRLSGFSGAEFSGTDLSGKSFQADTQTYLTDNNIKEAEEKIILWTFEALKNTLQQIQELQKTSLFLQQQEDLRRFQPLIQ